MMLRLKDKSHGVPDGWRYTHSETGYVSTGGDYWNWQENIAKHRAANSLPPITEADAENQLCLQIPPAYCKQEKPGNYSWVNTRLRFGDIARGMKAYLALITSGFKTVGQEEADRRAKICSSCYFRVIPQGCGACVKLSQLITGDLAKKKTAYDSQIVNKACAPCGCHLASIVHFEMPLLDQAASPEKESLWPDFCWRKIGGVNRIE